MILKKTSQKTVQHYDVTVDVKYTSLRRKTKERSLGGLRTTIAHLLFYFAK